MRRTPPSPPASHPDPEAADDGLWSTLSVAGVPCVVVAPDTTVVWANSSTAELIGTTIDELVGTPLGKSLGAIPGDRVAGSIAAVTRVGQSIQRLGVSVSLPDGSHRTVTMSAAPTRMWGAPGHAVVVFEAPRLAQTAASSQRDAQPAAGDVLTGLPGRATFESLLVSALRDAATSRQPFALLIGDLDGFRTLNQTYGPAIGDQVLQWVAERLSTTLHHHDTMGRLGGDEFVIIAERVPDLETARAVGRRLVAAIGEPIAGSEVGTLTMSVGITMATGLERPSDLLAEADRALQVARDMGAGSVVALSDLASPSESAAPGETAAPNAAVRG